MYSVVMYTPHSVGAVTECLRLEIPAVGLDKRQRQLLGHIVARATYFHSRQSD